MASISPGTQLGPYRILRQLGEGGMGAVFEAEQEPIGRHVAVKVLHSEFAKSADVVARFLDEARATNLVNHPSLVHVSDYGLLPDGTAFLVMELLVGESLGKRMERLRAEGQSLPSEDAIGLAWQIATALSAVHAHHITHRDLKPDNVMIVPDGIAPRGERIKILDFGIAKLTEKSTKKTATSAVMGTPIYMSPEQCRGAGYVDGKSDVYSLGVILFEMLSGRVPFIAEGAGELIGMHLFKAAPRLLQHAPQVDAQLAALVDSLLVKDPSQRPAMQQVALHLQQLLAGPSAIRATPISRWTRFESPAAARRYGRPLSILLGLLACGSAASLLYRWQPSATITWSIDTEPPGAQVLTPAGVSLGTTPWRFERPTGTGTQSILLRRTGSLDQQIQLNLKENEQRTIRLLPSVGHPTDPHQPAGGKQRTHVEYEE